LFTNCCIDAEKRKVRYQRFFIYSQHKALKGEITDRKKKTIPLKKVPLFFFLKTLIFTVALR